MTTLESVSKDVAAKVAALESIALRVGTDRGGSTAVRWSDDGLVVAVNHALPDGEGLRAQLPDGRSVSAELVGRDPTTDLALLRVDAGALPAAAKLADPAGLAAGQLLLRLARTPRGPRAALRLIAALGDGFRTHLGGRIDRRIELDATPARGFAGSLVASASGALLGLTTGALARGRVLVVPSATIERVVSRLVQHGSVRRGYLGIGVHPARLPAAWAERHGQRVALAVTALRPDSPAERAGVLVGDLVLAIAGDAALDAASLQRHLDPETVGSTVELSVLRGGEEKKVAVAIEARP